MLIVHSQLSSISAPATPSGWTLVDDSSLAGYRQIIWKRKRVGGDTSYTVAAASGASSVGSLLWVRSAGDVQLFEQGGCLRSLRRAASDFDWRHR